MTQYPQSAHEDIPLPDLVGQGLQWCYEQSLLPAPQHLTYREHLGEFWQYDHWVGWSQLSQHAITYAFERYVITVHGCSRLSADLRGLILEHLRGRLLDIAEWDSPGLPGRPLLPTCNQLLMYEPDVGTWIPLYPWIPTGDLQDTLIQWALAQRRISHDDDGIAARYPYPPRFTYRLPVRYDLGLASQLTPHLDRFRALYPTEMAEVTRYLITILHRNQADQLNLMLVGAPNSGKGTLMSVILQILGKSALCLSLSGLEDMSTRFLTYRKMLLYYDDVGHTLSPQAWEHSKKITSGESVTLRDVYASAIVWEHPVQHQICTGNRTFLVGKHEDLGSIGRRWEFLVWNSPPETPDPGLRAGIIAEAEIWFNQLLQQPLESFWTTHVQQTWIDENLTIYERWLSPIRAVLPLVCCEDEEYVESCTDVRDAVMAECVRQKFRMGGNKKQFSEELHRSFECYGWEVTLTTHSEQGRVIKQYRGVRLLRHQARRGLI